MPATVNPQILAEGPLNRHNQQLTWIRSGPEKARVLTVCSIALLLYTTTKLLSMVFTLTLSLACSMFNLCAQQNNEHFVAACLRRFGTQTKPADHAFNYEPTTLAEKATTTLGVTMKLLKNALIFFSLALGVSNGHAVPLVSVDVDPATPGVQTTTSVTNGGSLTVDIVIGGVEDAAPLNGFEFDLLFNPSLLAATGVVEGGFLLDPVFVAPPPGTQIDNSAGSVEMAAATLLPIGASGSGVLASIGFDTLAVGTSVLDLDNVLLSAPFGVPIEFEGLQDGSVEITPGTAVPEPLIPALLAGGLLALALQCRVGGRKRYQCG